MDETEEFYDQLADKYHLIFADWEASVRHQGKVLDRLIQSCSSVDRPMVLDCACGIGTQSIGLALEGYQVLGTDLSLAAVERARQEAQKWQVDVEFLVADMRRLELATEAIFDVVICFDNSLPHLLTDRDIKQALRSMRQRLRPGGFLLISVRDYDALLKERPTSTPLSVHGSAPERKVIFQLWQWHTNELAYDLTLFILHESQDGWRWFNSSAAYRALQREELSNFLAETGFWQTQWKVTDETGFYQPVVMAT